jgi:anthranilate synthase/aminodeoxychorismate synthase-like glutamine amidotransferase
MLIVIDNYDSFTYNLVQYFGEFGRKMDIFRNDAIAVKEIANHNPEGIVISPGPCTPHEAGISMDVIREYSGRIPILGVCLGHQSIGAVFGGNIIRAENLMHGKVSDIHHNGKDIFLDVPTPFTATRYHSLIIERSTFPSNTLEITAWTKADEIMGVRHKTHPTFGVQFHPESILTREGKRVLMNFLNITDNWNRKKKN